MHLPLFILNVLELQAGKNARPGARRCGTERFDRLLKVVNEAAKEQNGKLTGNTELVLVEEIDEKDDTMVTGRLSNNSVVHFKGDASLIGKIVPVVLEESKGFYYLGRLSVNG